MSGMAIELPWAAVHAITQLHYRFAEALDTNDWRLYRSCLADPVTAHYEGAGLPRVTVAAEDWVAFVAAAVTPQQTVHYFTNLAFRTDRDGSVHCRLNHQSRHRVDTNGHGDSTSTQFGTYETTVIPTGQAWLISSLHHRVLWSTGNPNLLDSNHPALSAAAKQVFGPSSTTA